MNTDIIFLYNINNLQAYSFGGSPLEYAGLISCLLFIYAIYILIPYLEGYFRTEKERTEQLQKRATIQELIMMKDIQAELEQEMQEGMLKRST
jgi:hypothetical protein